MKRYVTVKITAVVDVDKENDNEEYIKSEAWGMIHHDCSNMSNPPEASEDGSILRCDFTVSDRKPRTGKG